MEAITPAPNNFVANLINGAFEDLTSAFDTLIDPSRNTAFTNVKTFGAVGNGINDDTVAIQNALNSGGTIYFPAGTYLITSGLTATDVNITGDGASLSIIQANITSDIALSFINTNSATIQNIKIQGINDTLDTSNTSVGLLIQGNNGSTAAIMTSAYNIGVANFGTALELGNYTWLNKFYNCGFASSNVGVNCAGGTTNGENDSFYGCVINNNTTGVEVTAGYYDLYFYGTSFDYNTNYIFYANDMDSEAINFIGCHFEMDLSSSVIAPIYAMQGSDAVGVCDWYPIPL